MTEASWLASEAAAPVRAFAAAQPGDLSGASALRRAFPDLTPEQASAAMTAAALGRLARERYGIEGDWLLTRDGLEQATRPEVARLRARWLADAGITRVIDATAGLGFDSHAFASAGMRVTAIERDPATAALLRRNVPGAEVLVGDAADIVPGLDLADGVVFVDPARRDHRRTADGSRAHPERDPERWSPPWSWVEQLATRTRVCAKVAPAFTAPDGWQSAWTSVDRAVVDCFVASWRLAVSDARAVVLAHGSTAVLDVDPHAALGLAAGLSDYLHEPDPAVVRARGIDSLLALDGSLARLDEHGIWLTSDRPSATAVMRSFRIIAALPDDRRGRRRALTELGIERATAKTRDVGIDPRAALRDLGLREGGTEVVILARRQGRVAACLAQALG